MTESVLDLAAAGVNSTLSSLSSAYQFLISATVAVFLDEEGQFSYQSFQQFAETAYLGWTNFVWWLGITSLQGQVLKAFIAIFLANVVLIVIFWNVYSRRISHTLSFNSLRIVEDILKKNTTFKLPKEHTPRI